MSRTRRIFHIYRSLVVGLQCPSLGWFKYHFQGSSLIHVLGFVRSVPQNDLRSHVFSKENFLAQLSPRTRNIKPVCLPTQCTISVPEAANRIILHRIPTNSSRQYLSFAKPMDMTLSPLSRNSSLSIRTNSYRIISHHQKTTP